MHPPARDAGEAAARILRGLCPRSFAYAVERSGGGWMLRIECATAEGWQAFVLPVDPAELAKSLRDPALRKRLAASWIGHLRAGGASGLRTGGAREARPGLHGGEM